MARAERETVWVDTIGHAYFQHNEAGRGAS